MTKTKLAKHVADQIVVGACSIAAKKALSAVAPEFSENHETIAKIISGTAGYLISDKLQTPTHKTVDFVAAKLEARKSKKNPTPAND